MDFHPWKSNLEMIIALSEQHCRAPLQKACLKHHKHNEDLRVTPGTCGADGEKAQMIIVWVRASGVGNTSHARGLGVTKARP
jgi:hypothetical protein